MGINQIGYKGANQITPALDFAQNGGQQYIKRLYSAMPITLAPGQVFILPAAQWQVATGRYTLPQWYDTNVSRWRNFTTQPGQVVTISSDGQNFRIANLTGCPVAAVINNLGAGNATNGYNTITVTPSAGNSTWGTLVGGSLNVSQGVVFGTANGNFSLPPIPVWQPSANQTFPFVPPTFCVAINAANGNIVACNIVNQGAGLTGPGTLTFVQQAGDTNPGNANITLNSTLAHSGNLTALWPLTPGQNGNTGLQSVPTLTFNVGGGMAANVIMNFTVTGLANGVGNVGANYGNAQPVIFISANGRMSGVGLAPSGVGGNSNSLLVNPDYDINFTQPRMAWLTGNSCSTGVLGNGNVMVQDGGFGLQAVPIMAAIPANANGNGAGASGWVQGVFTAVVGGVNDTSYLQPI